MLMNPYRSQPTTFLVRSVSRQRLVLMDEWYQAEFILPRPATSMACPFKCRNSLRQMVKVRSVSIEQT